MKRVYSAQNLAEARLLADALERAGISTKVFNEFAQGALGDIPFQHALPEVWVIEDADSGRAERLMAEFRQKAAPKPGRCCSVCREMNPGTFDLCWRCGASLDDRQE